jgi:uncharacterized protein YceK
VRLASALVVIRPRLLVATLALLLCASGCMTVDTQLDKGYKGPRVYSGVRKDLRLMGPAFLNLSFGWVVITLFDLPFSLVADTLLLPVTIPRDLDRSKVEKEQARVDSERPALVHANAGEAPADTARRLVERAARCCAVNRRSSRLLSIDAVVGAAPLSAERLQVALREAIERHRATGTFVDWRDASFAAEGERVHVRATRRSTGEPAESALELVLAAGPDGGWRIVEESSVGFPER